MSLSSEKFHKWGMGIPNNNHGYEWHSHYVLLNITFGYESDFKSGVLFWNGTIILWKIWKNCGWYFASSFIKWILLCVCILYQGECESNFEIIIWNRCWNKSLSFGMLFFVLCSMFCKENWNICWYPCICWLHDCISVDNNFILC